MTKIDVNVTVDRTGGVSPSDRIATNSGTAGAIAGDALGQMLDKDAAAGLVAKTIVDNLFSDIDPKVLQRLVEMLNSLKNAGATGGAAPGQPTKPDVTADKLLLDIATTKFNPPEMEGQVFNQIASKLGSMTSVPPELEKSIRNAIAALNRGVDNGGIDKGQFDAVIDKAFANAKAAPGVGGDPIIKGLTDLLSKKDLSLADVDKAAMALAIFGVGTAPGATPAGGPMPGGMVPGYSFPGGPAPGGASPGGFMPGTAVTPAPAPIASKYPPGVNRFVADDGKTYVTVTGSLTKRPDVLTGGFDAITTGGAISKGFTNDGTFVVNFGDGPDEKGIAAFMNTLRQAAKSMSFETRAAVSQMVTANMDLPTTASIAAQILREQQRQSTA